MDKNSTENKELVTIIYFDSKPNDDVKKRISALQEINDFVLLFSDIDECITRVQLFKKEKIILILSENDATEILSRFYNIRQIDAIFTINTNTEQNRQLKERITDVFTNAEQLINAIQKEIEIIHRQLTTFSFYRQNQRNIRNLNVDSAEFLWFHVFKYVINRLPHDDRAKKEMLDASRHYYRDNIRELERINQFEQSYKSEDAINWFTKNSFIYRLINRALRTEDIEQLYIFRYFIQDLCSALHIKHQMFIQYSDSITVYRGLRLTQSEFDELINDEDKLISMNGYLSTSFDQKVAEVYAGKPKPQSDKISIIIQIDCNVTELGDSVVFAFVQSQSNFQHEDEVLFDIGATFQLTTSPHQDGNGVWQLKMIATDKGRELVRKYIDAYVEYNAIMSSRIMFGVLLYDMGKYDLSLSYFEQLLNNPEEEDVASIHLHIARIFGIKGDSDNEWKHYEHAYELFMGSEPKRLDDAACVLIEMGIFHSDRNENDRALEYLNKAISLFEQRSDGINTEVIRALLCIGVCYEQKGEYVRAIELFNQALAIQEQNDNSDHIKQCQILLTMGNTYRLQCKYKDALVQFRRVLDIKKKTLPKQHSEIADCLSMIGKTLGDMGKWSKSIVYSMRALDIYNKTLPSCEMVEKSSVLVDIGIAFSSVGADELAIKYYQEALIMKTKCLPRTHTDFAVVFENLGHSYSHLGKHLLAFKYSLRSFHFYKRMERSDNSGMIGSLRILAHVYSNMGCLNRAMRYLLRARQIIKDTLFDHHSQQSDVKNQIRHLKIKIKKSKRKMQTILKWKQLLRKRS